MSFGSFLSGWYGNIGGNALVPSYLRDQREQELNDPTRLGQNQRRFLDAAYPGTNPWEQLGASGASNHPAAAERNKIAKQHLSVQKDIAEIQAKAQIEVAKIGERAKLGAAGIPFDHPLGRREKESGIAVNEGKIDLMGAQEFMAETGATLNEANAALSWERTIGERWVRYLNMARYHTERKRPANIQADTDLKVKQGVTEGKRPANIQADTDLKGAYKTLTERQSETELYRPARVRAATTRDYSAAALDDQRAKLVDAQRATERNRPANVRMDTLLKQSARILNLVLHGKELTITDLKQLELLYEEARSDFYDEMAFGDRQKRVHPGFWQTFMYGWTDVPEGIDISPAEQRAGVGSALVGGLAGASVIPGAAAGKGAVAAGAAVGAGGAWVGRSVMGIIGKFKMKWEAKLEGKDLKSRSMDYYRDLTNYTNLKWEQIWSFATSRRGPANMAPNMKDPPYKGSGTHARRRVGKEKAEPFDWKQKY